MKIILSLLIIVLSVSVIVSDDSNHEVDGLKFLSANVEIINNVDVDEEMVEVVIRNNVKGVSDGKEVVIEDEESNADSKPKEEEKVEEKEDTPTIDTESEEKDENSSDENVKRLVERLASEEIVALAISYQDDLKTLEKAVIEFNAKHKRDFPSLKLDFYGYELSEDDKEVLYAAFAEIKAIESLEFEKLAFKDSKSYFLIENVLAHMKIEELIFKKCVLSNGDAAADERLLKAIKKSSSEAIKKIYFFSTVVNVSFYSALLTDLDSFKRLNKIEHINSSLNDEYAKVISEIIELNDNINEFVLNSNEFTNEGVKHILNAASLADYPLFIYITENKNEIVFDKDMQDAYDSIDPANTFKLEFVAYSESEKAPESSAEEPASSEEAPASSEEAPASSEEAPASSEEAPASSEKAPESSAEAPVSSAEEVSQAVRDMAHNLEYGSLNKIVNAESLKTFKEAIDYLESKGITVKSVTLSFKDFALSGDHKDALYLAFGKIKSLDIFEVASLKFLNTNGYEIFENVLAHMAVKKFNMDYCDLTSHIVDDIHEDARLAKALAKGSGHVLEKISFNKTYIQASFFETIKENVASFEVLHTISVMEGSLVDQHTEALSDLIKNCSTLKTVNIFSNDFSLKGIKMLLAAAKESKVIEKIDVSLNKTKIELDDESRATLNELSERKVVFKI